MADPATLDDIAAALYTQLATLLATATPTAGPFKHVEHFASETVRDRTVPKGGMGSTPAALLAFERETYEPDEESLAQGALGFIGTSVWRIFVVASEVRGHVQALRGASTTGVYTLDSRVIAAVAGLAIAGLYDSSRVMLVDSTPARVKPGEYVHVVRVSARRFVDVVERADDSVDLDGIDADINLGGTPDGEAPNPLTQFQADTTA
jgi:hypothetical protein